MFSDNRKAAVGAFATIYSPPAAWWSIVLCDNEGEEEKEAMEAMAQ